MFSTYQKAVLALGLLMIWTAGCLDQPSRPNTRHSKIASPNNEQPPGQPTVESPPFQCEGANCAGEPHPGWELVDFQPNSPRFEQTYGLTHFEGKTTVVALLAGWCSYCRKQALQLEAMQRQLLDERYNINIVVINKENAASSTYQNALLYILDEENQVQKDGNGNPIYRCTFPLFQDSEEINAWELHNGNKDDFYIYDQEGILVSYLPSDSPFLNTNLSTESGYNYVKQTIMDAYLANQASNTDDNSQSETP